MVNKRNFKLLKKALTTITGSLILGNCSTIWMAEKSDKSFNEIKNEFQDTIAAISMDVFTIEQRCISNIKKAIRNKIPKNIYQSGRGSIANGFAKDVAIEIAKANPFISKNKTELLANEAATLLANFINGYDAMMFKFSKYI